MKEIEKLKKAKKKLTQKEREQQLMQGLYPELDPYDMTGLDPYDMKGLDPYEYPGMKDDLYEEKTLQGRKKR